MSTRLENDEAAITLALKEKSLDEIDDIIEHVINFKEKLLKQGLEEEALEKMLRHSNTKDVRVAIKRTKFHREPKYQFEDKDGNYSTWAGVGKMPLALKEQITIDGEVRKELLINYLIREQGKVVKYQFTDTDGMVRTWDGKGKVPLGLQILQLKGFKLENFEVKEH